MVPVMAGRAATQQQAPRHAAVEAVLCGKTGSLLGQGVLARFKSWSIDNEKGTITVVGPPINGEAVRLKARRTGEAPLTKP